MSAKITPPVGHQILITEDGSHTFFSEAFQEACHSTSGAKAETLLHYLGGCKVKERLEKFNPFVILEVGFGLGIGFLTTLEELGESHSWHFISMEIDQNLLEWFRIQNIEHPFLSKLEWKEIDGVEVLEAISPNIKLTILQGDARKTLPCYMKNKDLKWHAIYQDAFSPKKNPILWTKEWFSFLKAHAHEEVILSTYSASSSIRKSLLAAGWQLKKGDKFGPKRTSTRAILNGNSDEEILLQLERSPVHALSDDNIEEYRSK